MPYPHTEEAKLVDGYSLKRDKNREIKMWMGEKRTVLAVRQSSSQEVAYILCGPMNISVWQKLQDCEIISFFYCICVL